MRAKLFTMVSIVIAVLLPGATVTVAQGPEPAAAPLGGAFTYQGRLLIEGTAPTGAYDFQFLLFDAAAEGDQVGSTVAANDLEVSDGLFTVQLDFGADAFAGDARWLEIRVREGNSGGYTTLDPRQLLTATPYALWSVRAPWSGLEGIPAGFADGFDADTLASLSCSNGQVAQWNGSQWSCITLPAEAGDISAVTAGAGLTGGGTNGAVTLAVTFGGNGVANTASRSDHNHDAAYSAIDHDHNAAYAPVDHDHDAAYVNEGQANSVSSAMITNGQVSSADLQDGAALAELADDDGAGSGLDGDRLDGLDSSAFATASHTHSAADIASGTLSTDRYSAYSDLTAEGRLDNDDAADLLTRGQGDGRFWKLTGNAGTTSANFLGTTDAVTLTLKVDDAIAMRYVPTTGTPNVVGGSGDNSVFPGVIGATIAGGGNTAEPNVITHDYGTIGGGSDNLVGNAALPPNFHTHATVGGGSGNTASGDFATVAGGIGNTASGGDATVGGGRLNTASFNTATVGGGYSNEASDVETTIGGGANNEATVDAATVGGGKDNTAGGEGATVAGGEDNQATGDYATIGGGYFNEVDAAYATIAGGGPSNLFDLSSINSVTDNYGTIGGGGGNQAGDNAGTATDATFATIGGGENNTASGSNSTVGGGQDNTASGDSTTVGGGSSNAASADYATVPGGRLNTAAGDYSFAAGRRAKANHQGAFVWADSVAADMASTANNQFIARATGGFFFQDDSSLDNQGGFINTTTGAYLTQGGVWTNNSDATLKENFTAVDGRAVLSQVARLPISTWNYKAEADSVRHMGPTAQDFYAAFAVGNDDRHIGTVDSGGVALAAIQGLNAVVEEKEARIAALEVRAGTLESKNGELEGKVAELASQNEELEARLAAVEAAVGAPGARSAAGRAPAVAMTTVALGLSLAGALVFRMRRGSTARAPRMNSRLIRKTR